MFNSGCSSSFAKWICLSLALALALFSATPTRAQVSGATLSGLVTDENGGPVPGATVSIKNVGTGVAREAHHQRGRVLLRSKSSSREAMK